MKTQAAIVRAPSSKFEVVPVDLDDPRQGELRVKLVACGLCHSDDHMQAGTSIMDHYPMVGGHEGAGIVDAVGANTPGWRIGDHVIFSFVASCGRCRWCAEGMTNLCNSGRYSVTGCRYDDPGSYRFSLDGQPVGQFCGVGAFAEYTTVSVHSAIKVDDDLPLDKMCLLGCAVGTGWGSAVNSGSAAPGDVVVVMGVGGIGVNAVQGAAHAGATAVVAVDPIELKRETALGLGATHAFPSMGEAEELVKSLTDGQGADCAIVAVGVVTGGHIAEAVGLIRKGGTVVVTGLSEWNDTTGIPINPRELTLMQKRIQGSIFGQCNPLADVPRQIQMYRSGQLKLDELVTRTYSLDEVLVGYEDMNAGRNVRGVILFD
jgi:S-(hydroxymethyl)glutathione dehydrogenase/alcohol dehydrogenase